MSTPIDLKFVTSDKQEFLIPSDVIKMSLSVKTLLNDLGLNDLELTNADPIPLQNVNGKTLEKVIVWCKHHLENPDEAPVPAPTEESDDEEGLSTFAYDFFKISQTEIFELILAANYLNIEGLIDAGCKKIAVMMDGLSAQELRDKFELVNDFTPEEEKEVSKENPWSGD